MGWYPVIVISLARWDGTLDTRSMKLCIPESRVPISGCSDCSKVGVSPIREREEEWKLDCQKETEHM